MDSEEIGILEMNETCCHSRSQPPSYYVAIPSILVGLVAFILDLIVIYVIAKCKDLQTISNLYIFNWRICSALFMMLSPLFYAIVFSIYEVEVSIFRVWQGELIVLFTASAIIVSILHLDWYLLNYMPSMSLKLRKHFKSTITFIWIIVILLSVYICVNSILGVMDIWIFSLLTICFVMFSIIQIMRIFKQKELNEFGNVDEKSNLIFFLVTCYVICHFAICVVHGIRTFDSEFELSQEASIGIHTFRSLNSVFVFILMYYFERDFKTNFKKLCCCKVELLQSQKSYTVEP